ncbi:MAG TPA: GntR family transcriptional regulator [Alphaproteobacteria bacterium]|nr:GntR family transcriptional regulator [Alphaproteobacteria bacterium]
MAFVTLSAESTTRPQRAARNEAQNEAETLTDRAYRELEELIVTLRIAPGTVVSEALLSKRLGIGRTPIREALQRLARERLVLIMPRRGIVVSEVNVQTQLRLMEVRRELERLLARASARRASEEQRARFREIAVGIAKSTESGDETEALRYHREFDALMLEASRNEFATSAMALMHGLSRRFWMMHYKSFASLLQLGQRQAAIAEAIARGDRDAAAEASDRLMDYLEDFTRRTIAES